MTESSTLRPETGTQPPPQEPSSPHVDQAPTLRQPPFIEDVKDDSDAVSVDNIGPRLIRRKTTIDPTTQQETTTVIDYADVVTKLTPQVSLPEGTVPAGSTATASELAKLQTLEDHVRNPGTYRTKPDSTYRLIQQYPDQEVLLMAIEAARIKIYRSENQRLVKEQDEYAKSLHRREVRKATLHSGLEISIDKRGYDSYFKPLKPGEKPRAEEIPQEDLTAFAFVAETLMDVKDASLGAGSDGQPKTYREAFKELMAKMDTERKAHPGGSPAFDAANRTLLEKRRDFYVKSMNALSWRQRDVSTPSQDKNVADDVNRQMIVRIQTLEMRLMTMQGMNDADRQAAIQNLFKDTYHGVASDPSLRTQEKVVNMLLGQSGIWLNMALKGGDLMYRRSLLDTLALNPVPDKIYSKRMVQAREVLEREGKVPKPTRDVTPEITPTPEGEAATETPEPEPTPEVTPEITPTPEGEAATETPEPEPTPEVTPEITPTPEGEAATETPEPEPTPEVTPEITPTPEGEAATETPEPEPTPEVTPEITPTPEGEAATETPEPEPTPEVTPEITPTPEGEAATETPEPEPTPEVTPEITPTPEGEAATETPEPEPTPEVTPEITPTPEGEAATETPEPEPTPEVTPEITPTPEGEAATETPEPEPTPEVTPEITPTPEGEAATETPEPEPTPEVTPEITPTPEGEAATETPEPEPTPEVTPEITPTPEGEAATETPEPEPTPEVTPEITPTPEGEAATETPEPEPTPEVTPEITPTPEGEAATETPEPEPTPEVTPEITPTPEGEAATETPEPEPTPEVTPEITPTPEGEAATETPEPEPTPEVTPEITPTPEGEAATETPEPEPTPEVTPEITPTPEGEAATETPEPEPTPEVTPEITPTPEGEAATETPEPEPTPEVTPEITPTPEGEAATETPEPEPTPEVTPEITPTPEGEAATETPEPEPTPEVTPEITPTPEGEAATETPEPEPTPEVTPEITPTPEGEAATETPEPEPTPEVTPEITPTPEGEAATETPEPEPTPEVTPEITPTPEGEAATETPEPEPTPEVTPEITPTPEGEAATETPEPEPTPEVTPEITPTPEGEAATETPEPEPTPEVTPEITPTPEGEAATETPEPEPTPEVTPEITPTPEGEAATETPEPEPTPEVTPEITPTPEGEAATETPEPEPTPEVTPEITPTPEGEAATETPEPEPTPEVTPEITPTPEGEAATETPEPEPTPEVTPEITPTPEGEAATETPEPEPTPEVTPEITPTPEGEAATETPEPEPTPEVTPEITPTPEGEAATETPEPEPTPEVTPEITPTPEGEAATETPEPEPTPEVTPEITPTPEGEAATETPTAAPTPTEGEAPTVIFPPPRDFQGYPYPTGPGWQEPFFEPNRDRIIPDWEAPLGIAVDQTKIIPVTHVESSVDVPIRVVKEKGLNTDFVYINGIKIPIWKGHSNKSDILNSGNPKENDKRYAVPFKVHLGTQDASFPHNSEKNKRDHKPNLTLAVDPQNPSRIVIVDTRPNHRNIPEGTPTVDITYNTWNNRLYLNGQPVKKSQLPFSFQVGENEMVIAYSDNDRNIILYKKDAPKPTQLTPKQHVVSKKSQVPSLEELEQEILHSTRAQNILARLKAQSTTNNYPMNPRPSELIGRTPAISLEPRLDFVPTGKRNKVQGSTPGARGVRADTFKLRKTERIGKPVTKEEVIPPTPQIIELAGGTKITQSGEIIRNKVEPEQPPTSAEHVLTPDKKILTLGDVASERLASYARLTRVEPPITILTPEGERKKGYPKGNIEVAPWIKGKSKVETPTAAEPQPTPTPEPERPEFPPLTGRDAITEWETARSRVRAIHNKNNLAWQKDNDYVEDPADTAERELNQRRAEFYQVEARRVQTELKAEAQIAMSLPPEPPAEPPHIEVTPGPVVNPEMVELRSQIAQTQRAIAAQEAVATGVVTSAEVTPTPKVEVVLPQLELPTIEVFIPIPTPTVEQAIVDVSVVPTNPEPAPEPVTHPTTEELTPEITPTPEVKTPGEAPPTIGEKPEIVGEAPLIFEAASTVRLSKELQKTEGQVLEEAEKIKHEYAGGHTAYLYNGTSSLEARAADIFAEDGNIEKAVEYADKCKPVEKAVAYAKVLIASVKQGEKTTVELYNRLLQAQIQQLTAQCKKLEFADPHSGDYMDAIRMSTQVFFHYDQPQLTEPFLETALDYYLHVNTLDFLMDRWGFVELCETLGRKDIANQIIRINDGDWKYENWKKGGSGGKWIK